MAYPTNNTLIADFNTAADPLGAPFDPNDHKGGTANRLKAVGGQMTKNQPSTTGYGSQVVSTIYGASQESYIEVPVKCDDGHQLLAYYMRLQTIGASTSKAYAVVVVAAAGADVWTIYRVTAGGTFTPLANSTQEVSPGDFIGAEVIDNGSGQPVIKGYRCPAGSDPTLSASWSQPVTFTDTDGAKITGAGQIALEVQGTVSRFDNLRGGTVSGSASAPANTTAPALTGSSTVGSSLTCSQGTWSNTPTSYTYQWKRDNVAISGATTNTYLLVGADAGTSVKCTVTASNTGGSVAADSNAVTPTVVPGSDPDVFVKVGGSLIAVKRRLKWGGALV